LVGISRIDHLPPYPPGAATNLDVQPVGIPVPIFEVLSDEEIARGAPRNTGPLTAVVYRNSHDNGLAQYNKADTGSFTGNLLHLGNGFSVDGGEIKGYDLLVHNSASNPGGDATVQVSLWDGDPLGVIDTRISDPPQPIPGTSCTFTGLVEGGIGSNGCTIDSDGDTVPDTCDGGFLDGEPCDDDTDCGLCPALPGDDIPECPGLYRLVCNFDDKVILPGRNVWMIVEWLEGCRTGWRWAFLEGPEVGVPGEQNFCADTCVNSPVSCVDMAIEMVDAASQWSSMGVGTCCEDDSIVCDHSDYDGTNPETFECGHGTSCGDGVATDFDAWCFGAPSYFASFVASIYANTDTYFKMFPIAASGEHTIVDDEIIMPGGGQTIHFEVFAGGWDPEGTGWPIIKTWQASIDSSGYTSGSAGELTNSRPPCTTDEECPDHETYEWCTGTYCSGAWIDPTRSDLSLMLPACDVSYKDPRCGSSGFHPIVYDPGYPMYAMSLRLEASPDAKGTFEIGFRPDPHTFMKDANSAGVPLIALVPAKVTIATTPCCDITNLPYECIENLTLHECQNLGGLPDPDGTCANGCHACTIDEECNDDDACTDDVCSVLCYNIENFDSATQCCDPVTGATCSLDDGDQCTTDVCTLADSRGDCVSVPLPDGTPCNDGEPCFSYDDECVGGECIGTDITTLSCADDFTCQVVTGGLARCDDDTGACYCPRPPCRVPDVVAEGPRYLAVTPFDDGWDVAIRVLGLPQYASCVDGYVQPDGRLLIPGPGQDSEELAVYLPPGPDGWGTVHVRGEGVIGGTAYVVMADCDPTRPGIDLSSQVFVSTNRPADVGGPFGPDLVVDFVDISMVVDAFRSDWGTPVCCTTHDDCAVFGPQAFCNVAWPGCETPIQTPGRCMSTTENVDLIGAFGCGPDRVIDFNDISAAVDAFGHHPDPCDSPCF
jgi:hypothetical protein